MRSTFFFFGSLVLFGLLPFASTLVKVNLTESIPTGIYKLTGEAPARGDYVFVCPPANPAVESGRRLGYIPFGQCSSKTLPVFKRLVGLPGDRIRLGLTGVEVNGVALPGTQLLDRDADGNRIPRMYVTGSEFTLRQGQRFLLGDSMNSFDSRYFGPTRELPRKVTLLLKIDLSKWSL